MGRYNLAPQRVHTYATQLIQNKRIPTPPPWYNTIGTVPPAERLVRPPLQRSQIPGAKVPGGRKKSRLFKPLQLHYQEDTLRWEYFNDHPWELARPRVVLENDGKDQERNDWAIPLDHALNRPRSGALGVDGTKLDEEWDRIRPRAAGRPINGEAVIQRQQYLLTHQALSPAAAYDLARKEFYRLRHSRETEMRVAREEALSTGAFFGPGPNEIGMKLEDKEYEAWKAWAAKEIERMKQLQGSAYTGMENEEASEEGSAPEVAEGAGAKGALEARAV